MRRGVPLTATLPEPEAMAVFDSDLDRPLYGRGPSPGLRFTVYAIVAIVLMIFDQRGHWVERIRYVLQGAAYPLQLVVSSPVSTWDWMTRSLQSRAALETQLAQLRARDRSLELAVMREAALKQENAQLRGLHASLPPLIEGWQLAEVVGAQTDSLSQRLEIDRGAHDGVHINQVVVDAHGILGQVARVGPWSAEVILLTDPASALPVELARTGERTIAVGSGNTGQLSLPYFAANADVRPGDLLVSSGLGGVFPNGLPVARVLSVRHASDQPLARVLAKPLATVDRDREVILLRFNHANPAAPVAKSPIPAARIPSARVGSARRAGHSSHRPRRTRRAQHLRAPDRGR